MAGLLSFTRAGGAMHRCAAGLLLLIIGVVSARAQIVPGVSAPQTSQEQAARLLRIFLDCDQCDIEYLKQNVAFVDYVRDRTVSDLHVLVTTQGTGGGGREWILKFIGLGRFQAQDRTLAFTTAQTATSDDERKEFARIFKIGLVAYAADTSVAPQLDVRVLQ